MKTTLLVLSAFVLSLPLPADPEPAEAAPADAGGVAEQAAEEMPAGWLGVSAAAAGEELMLHLGLDHGVMLRLVAPDSPAAKAGLAVHDLVTGVGDDAIGTMDDLRAAIQSHKSGDEVELKVIQKGRRVNKSVVLGEAPAAQAGAGIQIFPMGPNGNGPQRLRLNMKDLRLQGGANLELGVGIGGGSFKMRDADGSVEMKAKGEAREVVVRDRKGEIQFEGPWDTPQDKAAAPPEVKSRIDALDGIFGGAGGMLQMEVAPAPAEQGPPPKEEDKEDE